MGEDDQQQYQYQKKSPLYRRAMREVWKRRSLRSYHTSVQSSPSQKYTNDRPLAWDFSLPPLSILYHRSQLVGRGQHTNHLTYIPSPSLPPSLPPSLSPSLPSLPTWHVSVHVFQYCTYVWPSHDQVVCSNCQMPSWLQTQPHLHPPGLLVGEGLNDNH